MPPKLKSSIVFLAIFITGLFLGLFISNRSEVSKEAEVTKVELAHIILSTLAPNEVTDVRILSHLITGMSKKKTQDTNDNICKLIEMKVWKLEAAREEFMRTTIFKDKPEADPFFYTYGAYILEAKEWSHRAGCRK